MKKLSEYRDGDALDLLADLIEPVGALVKDEAFRKAFDEDKLKAVKIAIKSHKTEVMEILARMEGVTVEDYHCDIFTLPARLFEIITDEGLQAVFTSAVEESAPSASFTLA